MMGGHGSDLQDIPGVGPGIERDLLDIGITCVDDLKSEDPEYLYEKLCECRGTRIDRCVLYVFRCAVYYAENDECDDELLKWWNWKDKG